MRVLAPSNLLLICFGMTFAIAGTALSNLDRFNLVKLFMDREALDLSAFTVVGGLWILLSIFVYFVGDITARLSIKIPKDIEGIFDLERGARTLFVINAVLLSVTFLWIILSAQELGGLVNLAALAYSDSTSARDVLLGNKLFTGMRLFYAALPATGCFAAAILAVAIYKPISKPARILCIITLSMNIIALLILPIVMSQRLLLFQLLLSSYLVTCIVRKRIAGVGWLGVAALLFLTTWVLRESVTNALIEASALNIGLQKIAFYYVNDLWNGFAPLHVEIPHTYGGVSFRGFMFLSFTEDIFNQVLEPKWLYLDSVIGGGDFPFFTAAYVDFGPIFGAVFIALCAYIFRVIYIQSYQSLVGACIYAQLGAALLFSTHGIYFTHQNFLFSIAVITLIWMITQWKTAQQTTHVSVHANG